MRVLRAQEIFRNKARQLPAWGLRVVAAATRGLARDYIGIDQGKALAFEELADLLAPRPALGVPRSALEERRELLPPDLEGDEYLREHTSRFSDRFIRSRVPEPFGGKDDEK